MNAHSQVYFFLRFVKFLVSHYFFSFLLSTLITCLFSFQITKFSKKKEQLNQQVKQLKARKSQEERKARTKRLIEIGASVESVLGRPIEKDDLPNLIKFLEDQENRGRWFSKAMNKDSQNYNSNNDEQD